MRWWSSNHASIAGNFTWGFMSARLCAARRRTRSTPSTHQTLPFTLPDPGCKRKKNRHCQGRPRPTDGTAAPAAPPHRDRTRGTRMHGQCRFAGPRPGRSAVCTSAPATRCDAPMRQGKRKSSSIADAPGAFAPPRCASLRRPLGRGRAPGAQRTRTRRALRLS